MTRSRPRIAFQGERGAFSQVAAEQFAGGAVQTIPLQTFEELFLAVRNGKCDFAAIPIENTLHGSVHENYDLLLKYDLAIQGETYVRIIHNLIARPGQRFGTVHRVFSHPVALNQCRNFFEQNPGIERVSWYDTAGSVKMLMESGPESESDIKNAAAIASAGAARIYGAKILRRSIEDDRNNFTRFFLLAKPDRSKSARHDVARAARWKTTLVFTTRNQPGGLFRSLSAFALRDLNLTKIESRPLRGKPWEYLFYLDFIGHIEEPVVVKALGHLEESSDTMRILGCYPAS